MLLVSGNLSSRDTSPSWTNRYNSARTKILKILAKNDKNQYSLRVCFRILHRKKGIYMKNMNKVNWKPGNMLYPLPAVLVTCRDKQGQDNVLTVAWTGTVCSDPAMLYISVRPERYSYPMIKETGEFVVNLTTTALAYATDYCGVRSGRDEDKFRAAGLTKGEAVKVNAPIIMESPVNIECKVRDVCRWERMICFWQML